MGSRTFLFVGRSGCGKGTQIDLLREKLAGDGVGQCVVRTGDAFREMLDGGSLTSQFVRRVKDNAGYQPMFLAVWIWADMLKKNFSGKEHLIFDGVARRLEEAKMLAEAMRFYERTVIDIVLIDVSRAWAVDRLVGRGRSDDSSGRIEHVLDDYDREAVPSIEYLATQPGWKLHRINGEQTIPRVHEDIMRAL